MLLRLLYYLLIHSLLLLIVCSTSIIRIKCLKKGQSGITMVLLTIHNVGLILTPCADDHFISQTIRFPVFSRFLLNRIRIFLLFGRAHQNVLLMVVTILEKLIVGRFIKLAVRMPISFQSVDHFLGGWVHLKHLILILLRLEGHAVVRF